MRNHPEQTAAEFYAGNIKGDTLPEFLAPLKTARLGAQAYDLDGRKLPAGCGLRPLIVGNADAARYDTIMCALGSAAAVKRSRA